MKRRDMEPPPQHITMPMAASWTTAARRAHRAPILLDMGPSSGIRRRRKTTASPKGTAIMAMGNQLSRISPTAMSPKAPATSPILVREKAVRKVLNR